MNKATTENKTTGTRKPRTSKAAEEKTVEQAAPATQQNQAPAPVENPLTLLEAAAKKAALEYNEAARTDSVRALAQAKADGEKAVDALNTYIVEKMYEEFLAAENPMLAAVRKGVYNARTFKITQGKKGGVSTASIGKKLVSIDLTDFEDSADRMVSINGQWRYWCEGFRKLLVQRLAYDFMKEGEDKAKFDEAWKAKASSMGLSADGEDFYNAAETPADPISYTQLGKQLQRIVDAIVWVPMKDKKGNEVNSFKVTSQDVKYICALVNKESNVNSVGIKVVATSQVIAKITRAIHRMVNNLEYDVEVG